MTAERRGSLLFAWTGALLFAASILIFLHAYLVTFGRAARHGQAVQSTLVDIALFSVFALHHSLFARSGMKASMTRIVGPALERSVYAWISSILLIGVCLLWRPVPGDLYNVEQPWAFFGYAIQIAGAALSARGSSAIGVLDLAGVRHIVDASHGRVAPHGPLHTTGVFGFVRHPLYFAWVLFVFATPHMTLTRFVFAVVSSAYLALAIPFEERALIAVFGDDYRAYRRKVKWRMLPWVY